MKRIAIAAVVSLLTLSAARTAMAWWTPIGFSIAFDGSGYQPDVIGFPGRDGGAVCGIRLCLITGATDTMYGLAIGVLANGAHGENSGKDMADGDIAGIEIAGIMNMATSANNGAWQLAGGHNELTGSGDIVQIAGFMNTVGGRATGAQIASLHNLAEDDFTGVQIGAINRVGGTLRGVQVGVFNYADKLRGIQIGAINYIDRDCTGVQIGAFNILDGSDFAFLPALRVCF